METVREFRPELISRRSEITLWVLFLVVLAAVVFLRVIDEKIPLLTVIFLVFMAFAAGSTSLSNWMDRKTVLTLKPEGIDFTNGLRKVALVWGEIQEMRIIPDQLGKRVQILGKYSHFQFRTLGVLKKKGEIHSKMGFAAGDFIIEKILQSSGLKETDGSGQGHYYARP